MTSTEKVRSWRAANSERAKASARAYYLANREKILAEVKARYAADPTTTIQRVTEWVKSNPDRRRATVRKWATLHSDYCLAKTRNRRARLRGADGCHTAEDVIRIFDRQKGRCAGCGKRRKLTVDHYYPVARGGSNAPRNLQGLCSPCNSAKGARDPIEFMRARGMLL